MDANERAQLSEALRRQSAEEKAAFIARLAEARTRDASETLLQLLEHESWFLRERASRALVSMGDAVLEPLLHILRSGLWYARSIAAVTLGDIGDSRAASPLVDLARDTNRTVRDSALDALASIAGDDRGAHAVAAALHTLPERTRRFLLEGLLERDREGTEAVLRWLAEPAQLLEDGGGSRARAVGDDDSLYWEDVVGRGDAP